MQCRHTVPDWHRYVDSAGSAVPIFAACRLLVKEGELTRDPRSIECTYWGHQRDCPLYDGPGAPARAPGGGSARLPSQDLPVAADTVWPVRAPGARDGMRLVLIGLGVLSISLLVWTACVGLAVLSGKATPAGFLHTMLGAATVSIVTHVLATLRVWVGR